MSFLPLLFHLHVVGMMQAVLECVQQSIKQLQEEEQALLATMKEDDLNTRVMASQLKGIWQYISTSKIERNPCKCAS